MQLVVVALLLLFPIGLARGQQNNSPDRCKSRVEWRWRLGNLSLIDVIQQLFSGLAGPDRQEEAAVTTQLLLADKGVIIRLFKVLRLDPFSSLQAPLRAASIGCWGSPIFDITTARKM